MFYNPVITLLLPPDKRNQWQGMKTVGQLRREKNIKPETRADSLYRVSCIEFIIVLFSHAVLKEWSALTGHYFSQTLRVLVRLDLHWLIVVTYKIFPNFKNFIRFQKLDNQNVFQAILGNFDFLPPTLPKMRLHHLSCISLMISF